jgi:hypothetical protein
MNRALRLMFAMMMAGSSAMAATLHIAAPQPEQVIHDNEGRIGVVVAGLPSGARLQAMLDGAPMGDVQEAPAFELEDVPRGLHRLRVVLLDDQGRELASSEDVEFTLWRASARRGPPSRAVMPQRP